MEFLLNDLSFHGQFNALDDFRSSLVLLMKMRNLLGRYGRELFVCFSAADCLVTHNETIQQIASCLPREEQRRVREWLNRSGPFWEDAREHTSDDFLYVERGFEMVIVTDTAVGEAAFRESCGMPCGLLSVSPSDWTKTPLRVVRDPEGVNEEVCVVNHWTYAALDETLKKEPPRWSSWKGLNEFCARRFQHLALSKDAFTPIERYPFDRETGEKIIARLDELEKLKGSFDASGQLTPEGLELMRLRFSGESAWFSDSSETEKNEFRSEMTFKNPETGKKFSCFWHGKIATRYDPVRIHFSWPISAAKPLYVVYIGPKITKR